MDVVHFDGRYPHGLQDAQSDKLFISPYIGNNCRYMPTCSEYFMESLEEYGVLKGFLKGTKRILSCHPIRFLGGGEGFDGDEGG